MILGRKERPQLLGADGNPIRANEEIPFIQWLPNGESIGRSINRGSAVYAQAARFIAKGGRYAFVNRVDGMGELVAGFFLDDGAKGEMAVVAEQIVPNGPEIGPAIDRLVAASVLNMDRYTVTPETLQ